MRDPVMEEKREDVSYRDATAFNYACNTKQKRFREGYKSAKKGGPNLFPMSFPNSPSKDKNNYNRLLQLVKLERQEKTESVNFTLTDGLANNEDEVLSVKSIKPTYSVENVRSNRHSAS